MTTKYIIIALSGFFLLQNSYAEEIKNPNNFSGIVVTGKNPNTATVSMEKKIENGLSSSKNLTNLAQEIVSSLKSGKNPDTNISYLNQINKSILILEKKYSSNEVYKKTLNHLKSYVTFLLKEQTALKNKEGEKNIPSNTVKDPITVGTNKAASEINALIKVSPEQLAKYMQDLRVELASKVGQDSNFYYINNAISLSKKQFDGFELYDKNAQFCPSGYSIGLRNISPYNHEALGYFFTKNPNTFPSHVEGSSKSYYFWTKQDNWTDNFMAKNPKEKALSINNNLGFTRQVIDMTNYAIAWKINETWNKSLWNLLPLDEYYITSLGKGDVHSYTGKQHVICTNNLLKNQELKNIKALNNEISDSGFFAKSTWSVLGGYHETLALNTYNKNDVELYDFYLPVKLGTNYLFYKKDRAHTNSSTTTQEKKENNIVQGIYQLTEKKYKGNFQKNGDVCTTEFGSEWGISSKTVDAHIMTTKTQGAWMNLGNNACNNYSTDQGKTGISYFNNQITKNIECNTEMKVVCQKKPMVNYDKKLEKVTYSERDTFMEKIKSELNSKVTFDNKFIYINNYLSVSKQEFTAIQLHKDSLIQACPTGFSLATSKYDGKTNRIASNYTMEVLGYYLYKFPGNHTYVTDIWEAGKYGRVYKFWTKPDSTVSSYFNKFNEEQMSERGYDTNHNTWLVRMSNGYLEKTLEWRNKKLIDNGYHISGNGGSYEKVLEKRSALCSKIGATDISTQKINGINIINDKIIFPENSGRDESFSSILFGYQSILAAYNWKEFDYGTDYFNPIYNSKNEYSFYWKIKDGFNTGTQEFNPK